MSGPVVAIIGRPNVGKSTLFNRLVGERRAVVEDLPGTTVDRIHADLSFEGHDFTLVDCGGLELKPGSGLRRKVREQIEAAIREAHLILFLVDARTGVMPADEDIADIMRRSQKPVLLVANKVDGPGQRGELPQFYELNMGDPQPVSAYHGRGINELLDKILAALPSLPSPPDTPAAPQGAVMKIAIVGRPNVGKSLLVNTLLGEDRVVVDEVPGTTRDAVDTVLRYDGEKVVLIDTAGIRRPGRVDQGVEKHSLTRTIQAIERCDIAVLLIDAVEGITAQDIHILGLIHKAFKGAIVGINKIDLVAALPESRDTSRPRRESPRPQSPGQESRDPRKHRPASAINAKRYTAYPSHGSPDPEGHPPQSRDARPHPSPSGSRGAEPAESQAQSPGDLPYPRCSLTGPTEPEAHPPQLQGDYPSPSCSGGTDPEDHHPKVDRASAIKAKPDTAYLGHACPDPEGHPPQVLGDPSHPSLSPGGETDAGKHPPVSAINRKRDISCLYHDLPDPEGHPSQSRDARPHPSPSCSGGTEPEKHRPPSATSAKPDPSCSSQGRPDPEGPRPASALNAKREISCLYHDLPDPEGHPSQSRDARPHPSPSCSGGTEPEKHRPPSATSAEPDTARSLHKHPEPEERGPTSAVNGDPATSYPPPARPELGEHPAVSAINRKRDAAYTFHKCPDPVLPDPPLPAPTHLQPKNPRPASEAHCFLSSTNYSGDNSSAFHGRPAREKHGPVCAINRKRDATYTFHKRPDKLPPESRARIRVDVNLLESWKTAVRRRVRFMPYVEVLCLSAKTGYGVDKVLPAAKKIFAARHLPLPASLLDTIVKEAESLHISPGKTGRRLKIYSATQTAVNPPTFLFRANNAKLVHFSYRRHLENKIRQFAGFQGTPLKLVFKGRGEETGECS